MVGREPAEKQASTEYPAPEAVDPPAALLFGTVVLTNEPGWGLLMERGQETGGALILDVLPDSPAHKLGLKPGDVISWIDGEELKNHEQLLVAFRGSKSGEHTMRVKRVDGSTETIEAKLVPPASDFSLVSYLETRASTQPDPIVRFLLAEQLEDHDRAIELIRGLIGEHPQLAEGHALLARRLLTKLQAEAGEETILDPSSSDLEEVTRAIDTAVRLDPRAPSIYRARAQINLTMGQAEKAEEDARAALGMDDSSAETHYLLGTARLALGNAQDSLASLHSAVELDPYVVDYYASLALCYRQLGRDADATTTVEAAKAIVTDPEIRRRLDDLVSRPAA
ncbi:MAG TPA: tetratricopeptide repeat protein [Actinomycetota bacterium]|jgi:tetratricopeptide (TPR) repeat protein|nr:tetratricopeptide repeat protein [Actinomycetota bacterium]